MAIDLVFSRKGSRSIPWKDLKVILILVSKQPHHQKSLIPSKITAILKQTNSNIMSPELHGSNGFAYVNRNLVATTAIRGSRHSTLIINDPTTSANNGNSRVEFQVPISQKVKVTTEFRQR